MFVSFCFTCLFLVLMNRFVEFVSLLVACFCCCVCLFLFVVMLVLLFIWCCCWLLFSIA